jgi:NAD-dependent aldehyde dehydrogenases
MPQISIETIIKQAKAAQTEFENAGQEVVDFFLTGLAWSLLEPGTNRSLSNQAVHDTGLGNADDKFTKNYRKTLGLLRDLKNTPSVGVIKEIPEKGLVEIARPVGVVGAVTPSTNPIATPLNNTLNAIKGRNSIILAPSPKGDAVCELIVEILQKVLVRLGHPEHLIQKISSPCQ